MEIRPLVFECVLNDQELYHLNQIKNNLAECLINLHATAIGCEKLLYPKIELTLLDLREIINNAAIKGYKWNSYILQMVLLKTAYIMSILENMESNEASYLFNQILDQHVWLDDFLDNKYAVSIGDTEPETVG